ncbi:MAG: adenine nucleotide alpha hydrolase [Elusimicrobia bacterium]|nr:adenine nucleotide alpha hydrolase [Elusimicrobiota bacterium]
MDLRPAVMFWSSGKDSAYALERARASGRFQVAALLTTVSEKYGRVAIHGVREELLDLQAEAVGLPLEKIRLPTPCTNAIYERAVEAALLPWRERGARHVVFGDLFLEDLRAYREKTLARLGMEAAFPAWRRDTRALAHEMIRGGLRAVLSCVDLQRLPAAFAGRPFDRDLLAALPEGVDPCGENGEFHTFAHAGPGFAREVPLAIGETVEREGYAFCDLRLSP